jgi:hypothetical protein
MRFQALKIAELIGIRKRMFRQKKWPRKKLQGLIYTPNEK